MRCFEIKKCRDNLSGIHRLKLPAHPPFEPGTFKHGQPLLFRGLALSKETLPTHTRTMTWLRETSDGVLVSVRAVPNAPKNQVVGIQGDTVKIRLKAPPVDGKANEVLVRFLSEILLISRKQIHLAAGSTSRNKSIRITGLPTKDLAARLLAID